MQACKNTYMYIHCYMRGICGHYIYAHTFLGNTLISGGW